MTRIGPTNFSAIGGDGAANVQLAKKLIVAMWTWIIKLTDPCHHMSNTGKDIGKLEYFSEVSPTTGHRYYASLVLRANLRIYSNYLGHLTSLEANQVLQEVHKGEQSLKCSAGQIRYQAGAGLDRKDSLPYFLLLRLLCPAMPSSHSRACFFWCTGYESGMCFCQVVVGGTVRE